MDEVIDDIISMQSNYDDIQAYIDPIQMPNTVSRTNPPTILRFYCFLYDQCALTYSTYLGLIITKTFQHLRKVDEFFEGQSVLI